MHWLLITQYPPLTFYYLSSNPWNFSCQDSKCSNSLCHLFPPFPGVCSVLRVSSLWHSCVTSDQAGAGQLCDRAVISLVQGPLTSLGGAAELRPSPLLILWAIVWVFLFLAMYPADFEILTYWFDFSRWTQTYLTTMDLSRYYCSASDSGYYS